MKDRILMRVAGAVVFMVGLLESVSDSPSYKHIPVDLWVPYLIMFVGCMIFAVTFLSKKMEK